MNEMRRLINLVESTTNSKQTKTLKEGDDWDAHNEYAPAAQEEPYDELAASDLSVHRGHVPDGSYGFVCMHDNYDGAPDAGHSLDTLLGTGETIESAIRDYIDQALENGFLNFDYEEYYYNTVMKDVLELQSQVNKQTQTEGGKDSEVREDAGGLSREEYDLAARIMQQHGGGFVSKLMAAYFHADESNKAIIEKAFNHYFVEYLQKFNN